MNQLCDSMIMHTGLQLHGQKTTSGSIPVQQEQDPKATVGTDSPKLHI